MSEVDWEDRFVVEVSKVGTVDHIVDLEADTADRTTLVAGRGLPGEKLCSRSSRFPGSDHVELPDYAEWNDLDRTSFEGSAPDEICSYCWSNVKETVETVEQMAEEGIDDQIGGVGYRLRWKQKGRAREEWYDILVRPDTTMAELDGLVCRFSTLDDVHLRLYGLEGEYMDSSINVIPDRQYEKAGRPAHTKASEMTVGDVAERARLCEGDRLSLVYDFGTPSRYYCIVKEVHEPAEIDRILEDTATIATTDTAGIIGEKRP